MTTKGHHPAEVPCSQLAHAGPCPWSAEVGAGALPGSGPVPTPASRDPTGRCQARRPHDWQPVCSRGFKDLSLGWDSTSTTWPGPRPHCGLRGPATGFVSCHSTRLGSPGGHVQGAIGDRNPQGPCGIRSLRRTGRILLLGHPGKTFRHTSKFYHPRQRSLCCAQGPRQVEAGAPATRASCQRMGTAGSEPGAGQGRADGPLCPPAATSEPVPVDSRPCLPVCPGATRIST